MIKELDAAMAALKKDAARYRWLREKHETIDSEDQNCGYTGNDWYVSAGYEPVGCLPGELDEAIDKAMKASHD